MSSHLSRSLRLLLGRLTRHWVFRRRLPKEFGAAQIWVTPGAALAYLLPLNRDCWKELHEFTRHCVAPGDVVWDVGANLGVFAFCAAHRAGPDGNVLAIEADPLLSSLLNRSAGIRATRAPVDVLCAAAADQVGLVQFAITSQTRAGSHLTAVPGAGDALVGETSEVQTVVALTLDWLLERRPAPQVIKLDVEGAELLVLRGARQLLRRHRPKLLLEVHAHAAAEISGLLREEGYDIFNFGAGWADRQPVELATYHTLALPRTP